MELSAAPNVIAEDPLLVESPCDTCPHAAPCRDQQQACEQFKLFYERGGETWKTAPRLPSMAIYRKVFPVETVKAPKARRPKRSRRLAALDAREQRLSLFMLRD
jgi:hypothetical protein